MMMLFKKELIMMIGSNIAMFEWGESAIRATLKTVTREKISNVMAKPIAINPLRGSLRNGLT